MDQKVFDEAVNETMELLDMNYSEALKDTINQFQQMVCFDQDTFGKSILRSSLF